MTVEASRVSYVVSGTDANGNNQDWVFEASTVESAARKAQGHGMTVRAVVTQAERDAQVQRDAEPREVEARIVSIDTGAAIKLGFYAAIGAALVYVVVGLLLSFLAGLIGLGAALGR